MYCLKCNVFGLSPNLQSVSVTTECLKKYCMCFGNRLACSDLCVCNDCENPHGSKTEATTKERNEVEPVPLSYVKVASKADLLAAKSGSDDSVTSSYSEEPILDKVRHIRVCYRCSTFHISV